MDDSTISGILELHDIEEDDSLKEFPKESDIKISIDWNKEDGVADKDYPKFYKEKRLQEEVTEEEKMILETKVRLDDGTLGEVVTCYRKGDVWFYYCHPCLQEKEEWEGYKEHSDSKEHQVNLSKAAHARNKFITRHPNDSLTLETINLGLSSCNIQPVLDEHMKPLVGLEYLVESQNGFKGYVKGPQYYCLLCDILGSDKTILSHISSEKHYLKYFFMFFPTALEKLKQFATTHAKIPDLVSGIIGHVAARIETEYGRLKPQKVERDTFDQLKFKILTEIDKGNHFRETKEKTFEECVCLTHLHLSVCKVTSYQEKWKPLKEEKERYSEMENIKNTTKKHLSNNKAVFRTPNVPPFKTQSASLFNVRGVSPFKTKDVPPFKAKNVPPFKLQSNPPFDPQSMAQCIPPFKSQGNPLFNPQRNPPFDPQDMAQDISPFNPQGNPLFNPQGNPPFRSQGNPLFNPQGNHPFKSQGNPLFNPQGNTQGNPLSNPQVNPPFIPQGNFPFKSQGNPLSNPQINPQFNPQGNLPFKPQGNPLSNPQSIPPFNPHGNPPFNPQGIPPFKSQGIPPFKTLDVPLIRSAANNQIGNPRFSAQSQQKKFGNQAYGNNRLIQKTPSSNVTAKNQQNSSSNFFDKHQQVEIENGNNSSIQKTLSSYLTAKNQQTPSSNFFDKHQQVKLGNQAHGNNQKIPVQYSDLPKNFRNTKNSSQKRDMLNSDQANMNKRLKGNQGILYPLAQTSSQQVVRNVWETPNAGNSPHLIDAVRPLTNNNISISVANSSVGPQFHNKADNITHFMNQNALYNNVQNITVRNVQQLSNTGQTSQTASLTHSTNKNFQMNTNTNQTSQIRIISRTQTNFMNDSNFQNKGNGGQKNYNPPVSQPNNQVNSTIFFPPQRSNVSTITTNFNTTGSITRIPPPLTNNRSNEQQLNPIAFSAPPSMLRMPPSQRFNVRLLKDFQPY